MSLTYTVTVTCDGCGEWEHTDQGWGTRDAARRRRKRGWVTRWRNEDGHRWDRRDYCPGCVASSVETTQEQTDG